MLEVIACELAALLIVASSYSCTPVIQRGGLIAGVVFWVLSLAYMPSLG